MTTTPKHDFKIGDAVYKHSGDYTGPGTIRGVAMLPDGGIRYLVGHKIDCGTGEFLHVYSASNIIPITE